MNRLIVWLLTFVFDTDLNGHPVVYVPAAKVVPSGREARGPDMVWAFHAYLREESAREVKDRWAHLKFPDHWTIEDTEIIQVHIYPKGKI